MPTTADCVKITIAAAAGIVLLRSLRKFLLVRAPSPVPLRKSSSSKRNSSQHASAEACVEHSNDTEDKKNHKHSVWVYFGSQYGTARGFAKEICEEATTHGLHANLMDMEDFEPQVFVQHKCVVLVVATFYEGDPTDNAYRFFYWLNDESLDEGLLKDMYFTVMGLGNRDYINFNACGKIAEKGLLRLGATSIYERGEGDDDQDIIQDFEKWKGNGLWLALRNVFGMEGHPIGQTPLSGQHSAWEFETEAEVLGKLQLQALVGDARERPSDPLMHEEAADIFGKWYFQAHCAPVSLVEELRQKADESIGKSTKHIEIDVRNLPSLEWHTADNLEVLPRNNDKDVEWFAQRLGVEKQLGLDVAFVRNVGIEGVVKQPFPVPCSVRDALALYCDLGKAPATAAAKRFGALARNADDRAILKAILQDKRAYQWLTSDEVQLSLREFFELFMPSACIDLSSFIQLCPRQKNRPYTISSSSREDAKTIGICVCIVSNGTLPSLAAVLEELASRGHRSLSERLVARLGEAVVARQRNFGGTCSTMLCTRTRVGDKLTVFARASRLKLPKRASTPIIMVGAGTGLAPFRGFLREFRAEGGVRAQTILFFGCTKRDEDFIYRHDVNQALVSDPPLLRELVPAFSRDQVDKIYVQHRLREFAQLVADLIRSGAHIYVCGSVRMGRCVREVVAVALGDQGRLDDMRREGTYVEELW